MVLAFPDGALVTQENLVGYQSINSSDGSFDALGELSDLTATVDFADGNYDLYVQDATTYFTSESPITVTVTH